MSISDYLMQIPLKKANPTADALDAYAAAQAPQVPQMQANTSRTISEALFRRGGLLTDIAGMAFGAKADKIDAQNAQKLQQYGAEKSMYDTLLNWNRQDQLAQNKSADALDQYAREREAEQRKWAREDEVAQRNRDWSLNDRQALWDREDKLASNKTADALDQYAKEQEQKQAAQEESRQKALRGLAELQGVADRDSIGSWTRARNSIGLVKDKTRQDLGKISGSIAAIAPMGIQRLKESGVSGVNSLPEFLTYIGLPENPTSQEIAGALPIIRNTLGLNPTDDEQNKLAGYNKKYGL